MRHIPLAPEIVTIEISLRLIVVLIELLNKDNVPIKLVDRDIKKMEVNKKLEAKYFPYNHHVIVCKT